MGNVDILKNKFTETYVNYKWKVGDGESKSGEGSSLYFTENYREELLSIIEKYSIKKILDCSCGDWNWMSKISDNLIDYTGIDIVDELVKTNNEKFGSENVRFISKDMNSFLDETNENYDLIICRHTLEHLPTDYNLKMINLSREKTKYFLISSQDSNDNSEINFDGCAYRRMNLLLEPYVSVLGEPIYKFIDSPKNNEGLIHKDAHAHLYSFK